MCMCVRTRVCEYVLACVREHTRVHVSNFYMHGSVCACSCMCECVPSEISNELVCMSMYMCMFMCV